MEHVNHNNFLAVVGASDSGKSSVVRAGLIPAVRAGANWPIYVITPTAHPLQALATSLTRHSESVTATATLMDDLQKDARSLHLYSRKLLGDRENSPLLPSSPAPPLLLVVDQFEELFTLGRDESERQAFVANLVTAVSPEIVGPTRVVLTIRAASTLPCSAGDLATARGGRADAGRLHRCRRRARRHCQNG